MTETEQLKENAERARILQKRDEISAYLDILTTEIEHCLKRKRDSFIVLTVAWGAWMTSGFFVNFGVEYWFLCIYVMVLIYDSFRFARLRAAYGEFYGALEVLRILGFIERNERGNRTKKSFFEEGASMLKGWFAEKKRSQEQAYAPA